jgi:hypothetical protein
LSEFSFVVGLGQDSVWPMIQDRGVFNREQPSNLPATRPTMPHWIKGDDIGSFFEL